MSTTTTPYTSSDCGYCNLVSSPDYRTYYWVQCIVDFTLCLVILPPNYMVFSYFRSRGGSSVINFVYVHLSSMDLCLGICAFLHGVLNALFLGGEDLLPVVQVFIYVTYFCTSIALRMSVFYNVLLAIVRTIHIVTPFKQVKLYSLKAVSAVMFFLWIVMWVVDVVYVHKGEYKYKTFQQGALMFMHYYAILGSGSYRFFIMDHQRTETPTDEGIINAVFVGLPFVVPALIVFCTLFIQTKHLMQSNFIDSDQARKDHRKVTITVIALSIVFSTVNTAFLIHAIIVRCSTTSNYDYIKLHQLNITGTILPFLSSFINPIIFISRGSGLKTYVRVKLGLEMPCASSLALTTMKYARSPRLTTSSHNVGVQESENGSIVLANTGATTPTSTI